MLINGRCEFDGCNEWTRDGDQANCVRCDEGFSPFNGTCVECMSYEPESTEYWVDCASCAIDENGEPWDCLTCMKDPFNEAKIIYDRGDDITSSPYHYCQYRIIDNCA